MILEAYISLPWWGYVLVALGLTHITIAGTTLYLHRCQAHKAITLHPIVSHFFRFWLWLTTGMVTKEWVAVHRKHHAYVETENDPHSPQIYGINRVLWTGALLYHTESHKPETLEKYGHGSPTDWLERHLYTPLTYMGPITMLCLNVLLFGGVPGFLIWLTQMVWIPMWAAGVINGIGHFWGYRNFEVTDASRNIVPWAFVIGGEELHNNHHAYASSARFSIKPWEFDLGWFYIKILRALGLVKVNKTPPVIVSEPGKRRCDLETVKAVVENRFQVSANYIKEVLRSVCREEMQKTDRANKKQWSLTKKARYLLSRERLNATNRMRLNQLLDINPRLREVYAMKQRLQDIWTRSAASQENLLQALEEWCKAAEASGVQALEEFSLRLRGYRLQPTV